MTRLHGRILRTALGLGLLASAAGTLFAEELPYIGPAKVEPVAYRAEVLPGGAVKVTLKDSNYIVTSDFSLMPDWAKLAADKAAGFTKVEVKADGLTAEAPGFTLERKLVHNAECLVVMDTLTNQTDENLPVICRYNCAIPDVAHYYLAGRTVTLKRAMSSDPENPTIICATKTGSLGLLPLNDVFRVHSVNYAQGGVYGVADNNLVLKPRAAYTLRLAVFPSEKPDYYAQINAMRRFLDVNFLLDGPGACFGPRNAGAKNYAGVDMPCLSSTDEFLLNFMKCKSVKYVIMGREETVDGKFLNGPDWLAVAKPERYRDFAARLNKLVPGIHWTNYFAHNFYCLPDGKTKYAGCEVRNPDGSQADYRDPNYPLWLAIDGNAYAKDLEKTLDFITDTLGCDGVYWDEFDRSAATWHYGQPWDGFSGDIDPQTHKVSQLKSNITLLTQPWRVKMVERIQGKKKWFLINGAPVTETLAKYHFWSFTETGSISNCLKTHLYTPIALGDHMTERTELDCYRWMLAALQYGCVYHWYHDQVLPVTFETLTKYMYPITPVELGQGYIIGKERIITAKSGWFSFGDKAQAEAHFYGQDGIEVKRELPQAEKDGQTWFKLELAENESCALVRK